MASAPTLKEPTGIAAGGAQRWGGPDAVHCAELIKGTHSTEKIPLTAIDHLRRIVKKADEIVNNNITLQNDDELLHTLSISKTYGFTLGLLINSSSIANFKYAFTVPGGATILIMNGSPSSSTLVGTVDGTSVKAITDADGTNQYLLIHGRIIMSTIAGNVQLQWAQNTLEVSDTKVLEGSTLVIWEETI